MRYRHLEGWGWGGRGLIQIEFLIDTNKARNKLSSVKKESSHVPYFNT